MANDTKLKRLVWEVSEAHHKEVKMRAARRGVSIKYYLGMALDLLLEKERKYDKPTKDKDE